MFNVAIILFPGQANSIELKRAIEQTGMTATLVRWNESETNIAKFEGYAIAGPLSFGNNRSSSVINASEPMIEKLKAQTKRGKPLLGIGSAAEILVESGLVPGIEDYNVSIALGGNRKNEPNHTPQSSYYNVAAYYKSNIPPKRCAFTYALPEGSVLRSPIAHSHGRFLSAHSALFPQLIENRQIVFRYCSENGSLSDQFPVNPDGSSFAAAAICNAQGNVLAMLPHPERGFNPPVPEIFQSMKAYMFDQKRPKYLINMPKLQSLKELPNSVYQPVSQSIEIVSVSKILENDTRIIQKFLQNLGFPEIKLKKYAHYEVQISSDYTKNELKKIIETNELVNPHLEIIKVKTKTETLLYHKGKKQFQQTTWPFQKKYPDNRELAKDFLEYADINTSKNIILVREKEDITGKNKTYHLARIFPQLKINVVKSTIWLIQNVKTQTDLQKLLKTFILYSPHLDSFVYYN